MCNDGFHDRREPRNGSTAQIITVTETSRENYDICAIEITAFVPQLDDIKL
jgi:hypothetical protein